jgi:hypothetical protein
VTDEQERPAQGSEAPSEEELRAALEEQMRKVRVEDLLLQSVASLVNLSARRIAKEDERDLAQAKVGIEAVRALVDLLPEEAATEVRNALSDLQMLYARTAGEGAEGPEGGAPKQTQVPEAERAGETPQPGAGPRRGGEPPPRLWTPPGSS